MMHSSASSALRGGSSSTVHASRTRYRSFWNVLDTPFPAASRSRSRSSCSMSSVGGKPPSGSTTEWPRQAPLPGRELLDPLLPGFHLIPPGRGEHGGPQLGADRRQPGLFQLAPAGWAARSTASIKAERPSGPRRSSARRSSDHALGSGQTVTYVAQLGGGRGQFRRRGRAVPRRAGAGAPGRSRRDRAPWPAGTGPRSRPQTAGR